MEELDDGSDEQQTNVFTDEDIKKETDELTQGGSNDIIKVIKMQ